MDNNQSPAPKLQDSASTQGESLSSVLDRLQRKSFIIPDYQRDSDQWDHETKSLFVESIINNLSVPAFFIAKQDEGTSLEIIDGQQRLTTLQDFYSNKLRLVESEGVSYLSPDSAHYAGKCYKELPEVYQNAFLDYSLPVITLPRMDEETRLEVFRRINQGGTPLSAQDLRLAYYSKNSPSLTLVRLAGIYDKDRHSSQRSIISAEENYNLSYPWNDGHEYWKDFWNERQLALGQTPSECFLWSMITSEVDRIDDIIRNPNALRDLRVNYNGGIHQVLDAYCAQLGWQDTNTSKPPLLMQFEKIRDSFFPHFECWIIEIFNQGSNLSVSKWRPLASIIGAAYTKQIKPADLSLDQWTNIIEFIRSPAQRAKKLECDWPESKGKWEGNKGYRTQMRSANIILQKIMDS